MEPRRTRRPDTEKRRSEDIPESTAGYVIIAGVFCGGNFRIDTIGANVTESMKFAIVKRAAQYLAEEVPE